LSASASLATVANLARFSTVHHLRRLSPPKGVILLADSDSSKISRRQLAATPRIIKKRKRFLQLAGPRCPTIICEFLTIFEDLFFFRRISDHSLIGLDNGAMLLLGGIDWGSTSFISGIWELKEDQWKRIGELDSV
jgi:hypothetical protein